MLSPLQVRKYLVSKGENSFFSGLMYATTVMSQQSGSLRQKVGIIPNTYIVFITLILSAFNGKRILKW